MTVTRRVIVAGWFFLLAALVIAYGGTWWYVSEKYPSSAKFIQKNLFSPNILDGFKVDEAKKVGYSETEISEYLAQQNSARADEIKYRLLLVEAFLFSVAVLSGLGFIALGQRPPARLG